MLPFPNISPEIFTITVFGINFSLRWYAISYILGFVCAIYLMKYFVAKVNLWEAQKPPMTSEQADSFLTYLIIGVILGGRLGYVLFYNPIYYFNSPLDILRVWDGGMAFHGGFIGVVVSVFLYCKQNKIPLLPTADLVALSSPPGLFLGRLANFINAELWGKPTNVPWGVIFPGERAQDCFGITGLCARHPSQLYEALLEGFLLFVLLFVLASKGQLKRCGSITGLFLIGYGASRFIVEYFRVPDPQFFSSMNPYGYAFRISDFGLTMGQALSLPMIALGLLFVCNLAQKAYKI
jgi:phosphatidylglycerol:prolipoprotein diacylglycerol transferase